MRGTAARSGRTQDGRIPSCEASLRRYQPDQVPRDCLNRAPGRRRGTPASPAIRPQVARRCRSRPRRPAHAAFARLPRLLAAGAGMVFRISFLLIVLLAAAAGLAPERFAAMVDGLLSGMLANTGWLYLLVVFATLVFMLYLAFGSMGELRIGGEDAEPRFSAASWLAMLFAAGMGIGLVFWGAAEPLSHYFTPPEALEPASMPAARAAMRYSFFHWGLHPWAIYALVGLAMAWFQYNRRGRGQLSDLLQPVLGRHHRGWAGRCVDIAAVVATA